MTGALTATNKERKNHLKKSVLLWIWGSFARPHRGFTPEVRHLLSGLANEVQFIPWGGVLWRGLDERDEVRK